jgi:hypothetical protein
MCVNFIACKLIFWSRDSSVSIVTGYGIGGLCLIPGRSKIFLFFIVDRPAMEAHEISYQMATGIKRPGREADHSPPCSVEIIEAHVFKARCSIN